MLEILLHNQFWKYVKQPHSNVRRIFFLAVAGAVLLLLLVHYWPLLQAAAHTVLSFAQDEEAIERVVIWLGWFGPPILILFNALQIVVAPIPAYALFVAAGFLYGAVWGGIYGTLGTLLGATMAMLLSRRFGRPWVERMVGDSRLDRWNEMTNRRGWLVWGLLLLAPVGDIPYFLAGLSQVSVQRILMLTLVTRVPTIFLIAAAASGSTSLGWLELVLLIVGMVLVFGGLWRYQGPITDWFDRHVQTRLAKPVEQKKKV